MHRSGRPRRAWSAAAVLLLVALVSSAPHAAARPVASPVRTAAPALATVAAPTPETVATGLDIPWDLGFLPDGSMVVTERPGRIRVYESGSPGARLLRTVTVPLVRASGESGVLGLAVDVDFAHNRYVYVCASRDGAGTGGWTNQVLRYAVASSGAWSGPVVLRGGMAANTTHNGCALEMDATGHLWVGMGDAAVPSRAQDRHSLNGKVLRMTRTGGVPADNPVIAGTRDVVWSMGHRNPQGIAFRPGTSQVYEVEHGPAVDDEVNLLAPGGNYGWPCYTGDGNPNATAGCQPASAYRAPLWASGNPTLATSGGSFARGSLWGPVVGDLFVSTLKEQDLREFTPTSAGTALGAPATLFDGTFGRLRASVPGPGGQLYVTTGNGSTDRVVRLSPARPTAPRVAGTTRYDTAAATSRAAYPGGASDVVVTSGEDFPDALAAAASAGAQRMPLLLTTPTALPAATRTELQRLAPTRIWVVGGPGAVGDAVLAELDTLAGGGATRVAGVDRFETAAAVSRRWASGTGGTVYVATGMTFADALAGAPAAARDGSPLLLVGKGPGGIPDATRTELARLAPRTVVVLGGTGVVTDAMVRELTTATTATITRVAGADRYATAAALARRSAVTAEVWLASGSGFADALAGAAAAGSTGDVLLLVTPGDVPLVTGAELLRLAPARATVLGGTGAVSPAALARVERLVGTR